MMGMPQKIQPKAKLVIGLLSNDEKLISKTQDKLSKQFGRIDFESGVYPFNFTSYYEHEFGKNILRKYITFEKLIGQQNLARIKLLTNLIENFYASNDMRRVNIDPGYITLAKLVLASTKDHQHRIYQHSGIFNEVTLRYVDKSFQPWPWTYPDYKHGESIDFFNRTRSIYKNQISKKARNKGGLN